jgi:hypothetical protein
MRSTDLYDRRLCSISQSAPRVLLEAQPRCLQQRAPFPRPMQSLPYSHCQWPDAAHEHLIHIGEYLASDSLFSIETPLVDDVAALLS